MSTSDISNLFIDYLDSPMGILQLEANAAGLRAISFVEERPTTSKPSQITDSTRQQLREYFAGDRRVFDLPISVNGTVFQQQVWQQLTLIPYGQTCSYQDIATGLDNPKAVRAVGSANGKNPLTIVVPCHRVIGANGKLTGYAWGVSRKEYLLKHEMNLAKSPLC
ncbi:MAG: methylated-DNA-[protein]-cysteine S-methyltransferase [Paraglaciecola sp.]|jgi:methylated-DNA-[protein]-cysteine S-methyltransferase